MSNGSPGYFDDWNEFLTYLNGIANTTVFDKFRPDEPQGVDVSYHYNSEMSVDPNTTINVTPAIENIAAQLVHIVSSDPIFLKKTPEYTPSGESTGDMMAHGGWYLETTIFDPDNENMDSEPYIFLTCTQVGRGEQYLYGLLLSFIGTPQDPILNSFQLIAQRYHLPQNETGWKEDTEGDESKDWQVVNWAYIYSETPFISPHKMGVINFPYGGADLSKVMPRRKMGWSV